MNRPVSFYRRYGKRILDLGLTLALAPLLLPLGLLLALVVLLDLGAPALFTQRRIGLDGTHFTLRKFRTMSDATTPDGRRAPDGNRLSRIGALLRRASLDEIPELWNVIRGEMSLVGPRPLLPRYLPRYSERQARRHEVRPGLTGLAQVRGRNALTWEEKFEYDVEYVDRLSFLLDLSILVQTVRVFFGGRGISAPGHATMPEFLGSGGSEGGGPEAAGPSDSGGGGRTDGV